MGRELDERLSGAAPTLNKTMVDVRDRTRIIFETIERGVTSIRNRTRVIIQPKLFIDRWGCINLN